MTVRNMNTHAVNLPIFEDVRQADRQIQQHIHRTPILTSRLANERFGGDLFFKCENFQKTGAFKFRGALNAIQGLTADEAARGVITHSSGNHAQALSLAARKFGIRATVVMPENAPQNKFAAAKNYGAEVHVCAPTQKAREQKTKELSEETGAVFIPSYNNPHIIAGQGTVGYELFKEIGDIDQILAPVGGGGLISGIALAVKHINPDIQLIGVEPGLTNDAYRSFREGHIVTPERTDTIADGLRTSLGDLTFKVIRDKVDDIVTVGEETIQEAMRYIWERLKIVIEPSAAVPLAGIIENKVDSEDQRTVLVVSGGNADLDHLPWM